MSNKFIDMTYENRVNTAYDEYMKIKKSSRSEYEKQLNRLHLMDHYLLKSEHVKQPKIYVGDTNLRKSLSNASIKKESLYNKMWRDNVLESCQEKNVNIYAEVNISIVKDIIKMHEDLSLIDIIFKYRGYEIGEFMKEDKNKSSKMLNSGFYIPIKFKEQFDQIIEETLDFKNELKNKIKVDEVVGLYCIEQKVPAHITPLDLFMKEYIPKEVALYVEIC